MARKLDEDEMWMFGDPLRSEVLLDSGDNEIFWSQLAEKRDHRLNLQEDDVWWGPFPPEFNS